MADVIFKLDRGGFGQLLAGAEMQDDIMRRAGAVATAAGPGHDTRNTSSNRARASVMTVTKAAREAEARDHTLTRAIQAARG